MEQICLAYGMVDFDVCVVMGQWGDISNCNCGNMIHKEAPFMFCGKGGGCLFRVNY
jgi:hypothetical protein